MAFSAAPGAGSDRAKSRHVASGADCAGQPLQVACAWPHQVLGCQPCCSGLLLLQHLRLQGSFLYSPGLSCLIEVWVHMDVAAAPQDDVHAVTIITCHQSARVIPCRGGLSVLGQACLCYTRGQDRDPGEHQQKELSLCMRQHNVHACVRHFQGIIAV